MRSIFIFAHPDDEFGCFEVIRREVAIGRSVECYYLTDGGFGGQSIDKRQKESKRVVGRLGVPAGGIHFVGVKQGIPDGLLANHLLRAATELLDSIVDRGGETVSIFVPAWEGGHQDHDAAHVIGCVVANCLGAPGSVWQFPLYHGKGLPGGLFHVMKPLVENGPLHVLAISWFNRILYLRLCLSFPSQWKTWIGLFPLVVLKLGLRGCYYLQRAVFPREIRRPHDGPLLYERRGMARYEEVETFLRRFLDQSQKLTDRRSERKELE